MASPPALVLTFEIPADTSLADACVNLCLAARRQNVVCKAQFKNVILFAASDDDPVALVEAVYEGGVNVHGVFTACASRRLSDRLRAEATMASRACAAMARPAEGSA